MPARIEFRRGDVTLSALRADGAGPPVVLLHGLAGSATEMTALAPGRAWLALDQRGHGHSTRRPADLSRQAYVDDVLSLITEPVDLVGQSMGGHTAMLVAAARPDLVRRLVLIESGVGGGGPATSTIEFFARWPVPFPDRAAAAAFLGDGALARVWVSELEERPDGWWPRFDADVLAAAIEPVAAAARWDAWARVTAPTLLIRCAPGEEADRMVAARPGTRLEIVADAGHDVHLDQPEVCAGLLQRWL